MYRNDNNVEFKVRLKRRMDELRMSPKELAGKTGLSSMSIYHYLSGKSRPLVDSLNKLAAALNVDLLLKRNATRQAVNATKDMPYQGGGL